MKIVALHTDFRIYWPARLSALSSAYREQGDELQIIEIAGKGSPYSFAGDNSIPNLKWHILFPDSKPEDLSGKIIEPVLFDLLSAIRPDVIIAGAIAFPSGALAVKWGQKYGTRVIIFDDSKLEAVLRNRTVNFIKHAVYNGVDAMFYPAADWIPTGNFWGFSDSEMYYGVDVVDNDFWAFPRECNKSWGDYFVAVGRQIYKKNYWGIVKAYKMYADSIGRNKAYNLVLIGDGPEHSKIEEYVREQNLSEKVFLLPFLSQKELPGIYQNAKALCSSSSSETWGLVINEAMAGGCPIFASYECGASNVLVHDEKNGYKFHCDDLQRLAELMIKYHNLPSLEQKKMREASKQIIANWGLKRFVDGAIAATEYVSSHKKRRTRLIDKLIIRRWRGRYRPV